MVEIKDVCKEILDTPNFKLVSGSKDIMDGIGEYTLGAALLTGGSAGEFVSYGTSTPFVIAGWGLITKATLDVSSGFAKLQEAVSNNYTEEMDVLERTIGKDNSELVSIADHIYSTYDNAHQVYTLNSVGLGNAIIGAIKLYIELVEHFTGR